MSFLWFASFFGLKTWLEKCSTKEAKVSHMLCGEHFEDKYFFNPTTRNRLVWNAIPTIFQGKAINNILARVFYQGCQRSPTKNFPEFPLNFP